MSNSSNLNAGDQAQLEMVQALVDAHEQRYEVFAAVERAADREDAEAAVAKLLNLTSSQARAVLDMQLRRMTVLERQNLVTFRDEILERKPITNFEAGERYGV